MKKDQDHIRPVILNQVFFIFILLLLSSCGKNNEASPKPKTYPKIVFPKKGYQTYSSEDCDMKFEYPRYARIIKDSLYMEKVVEDPCWFDIEIPEFNAKIHCSHYLISAENKLDSLIYDSFALVGKHTIKASYIEEKEIHLTENGGGILFRLSGPVASPTQFFITDSTTHFFRGSLYFKNKVQIDSMSIIYDFVNDDIHHMLNTFTWN